MGIGVTVCQFGPPAFEALARTIDAVKGGDPLAPVTVIVERGTLGLTLRRCLAASPRGMANVRFTTWDRLAADVATGWLAGGRRPASAAFVHQAVRAALAADRQGPLASVGDHPATVRALVRTYRELAGADASALRALGRQSARAAEVVSLVLATRARLGERYDDDQLVRAAACEVARDPEPCARLGPVVVYLPGRIGESERALVGALAGVVAVEVLVGMTGDEAADAAARDVVAQLGGTAATAVATTAGGMRTPSTRTAGPAGSTPRAGAVRLAPSADAEVLLAMRHLLRRHRDGVALERMALLHWGAPPYPQLLADVAARAGLTVHGAVTRPLAATLAGRALLGAVALPERDWRRDDVIAWCGAGPFLAGGRPVPAATWDLLSCEAGVVGGLEQWRNRLAAHSRRLRARAARHGSPGGSAFTSGTGGAAPPTETGSRRDAACCDELAAFVAWAAATITERPRPWGAWARWATDLLATLLGPSHRRATWPQGEIVALDAVVDVLGELAELDALGGTLPALGDFATALAHALEARAPDTTRFGRGVLVGRVESAVGMDFDVVWILGAVEGAFASCGADDVVVPDRQREAAGGSIPLRRRRPAQAMRDYLAVVAGAAESVVSCPMADQRSGRALRPARVLLDTSSHGTGDARRLSAGSPVHGEHGDRLVAAGSYAEVVAGGGEPLARTDWALRSLVRWRAAHGGPADHPLARADRTLTHALAARRARRSGAFTRFDGLASGLTVPSPTTGVAGSPTGLETFARCPRRYLLATVLGVGARERPEALLRISPLDRGELVHRILERFVGDELRGAAPDDPVRLLTIAEEELADAERRGITGHPVLWQVDRSALLSDLQQFSRDDAAYRAETGAVPVALEERFGQGGDPGVEVQLGDGAAVRFGGRIDRVDRLAGGDISVIDYKSGTVVDDRLEEDPVARGTRLQLAVYGLAARQRHGAGAPVTAGYWFVGKKPAASGIVVDAGVEGRLAEVLRVLAGAISSGRFPANPGQVAEEGTRHSNCARCPYDATCTPDRVTAWRRKRTDPQLASYVALAEPS